MKRIASLPLSFRPREKLLHTGAEGLTIEELLACILITGTKTNPVSTIATKIAKQTTITKDSLLKLKIGPTKTAQILAAIELGKRLGNKKTVILTSADHVFANAYDIIHKEKESLLCLYLNARGELLKREIVATGSLTKVNILPREIFSVIKNLPVASIILVHNHPSGDLEPSKQDILFTKRVQTSADILGVKLLDHLIISDKGWKRIHM